ncbi:glycosyltransferase [Paenibacillus oralis]|uniref:Glycosyltransferase n=1 Tax=Paenibacillus oralis TaxID=2490856 RepID=A0A3P3UAK2_9BACL|nr:glycosyltransferase [Paenibacillus oralis]RRJ65473.1 glycosyltransferase [Paenibacillus oralis]
MTNKISEHIKLCSEGLREKVEKIKEFITEDIGISIIVLSKNEERCIKRCVDAIMADICSDDEVIVIDTGSNDKTLEIIRNREYFRKIRILEKKWGGSFSEIRNFGISISKKEWIFFVDADETIEKGSISNLKRNLKEINMLYIDVVCCPAIVNIEGKHVIQTARRIIPNNGKIEYFGKIHEEPKYIENKRPCEFIAFDNVILHHDGYMKSVILEKNKQQRNITLLKSIIEEEPDNPRWFYLYSRDGKGFIDNESYKENLLKTIEFSKDLEEFKEYKVRALSDLIEYYLSQGMLEKANQTLKNLKSLEINVSDVLFWEITINLIVMQCNYKKFIEKIIEYKKEHTAVEYGSLNSNGFHLDYLLSRLFFNIREYEKSFSIFNKLEKVGFGDYKKDYYSLQESLKKYLG